MDFEFKSLDFYRQIPRERWACWDSCGSMIDFKLSMETYIIVDILAITFDMIN